VRGGDRPVAPLAGRATLSVSEAARLLGIGRGLACRLARRGELAPGVPVLRLGGRYRVPARSLAQALGYLEDAACPEDAAGPARGPAQGRGGCRTDGAASASVAGPSDGRGRGGWSR